MMSTLKYASNLLLSDKSSIAEKVRALFTLRNIHTDESALEISRAFSDNSVLLKHELAYVLGQMTRECSIPALISVLENEDEDEIVRHEAAEALGNYKNKDYIIEILEKFVNHRSIPLRETCILAIRKIRSENVDEKSLFLSLDPAYPAKTSLGEAEKLFTDKSCDLYKKYQIMFFLRNLMTEEAVQILVKGFGDDSHLFKHEIAFVLGQMQIEEAAPYLIKVLNDDKEHEMVRHECAEALGAIGTEDAKNALLPFLESNVDILRESAEVALDIYTHKKCDESEYCFT